MVDLRPAAGRDGIEHARRGTNLVAAEIVDTTERSHLLLATTDSRVFELSDRAVQAESTSGSPALRVQGMLQILVKDQRVLCLLSPFNVAGAVDRRQWVRVPTVVAVEVRAAGSGGGQLTFRTNSVDLSGGGVRLLDGSGLTVGTQVRVCLELSSGPLEVDAEVLDIERKGMTRLRFLTISESACGRIVRHVFHAQIAARRSIRNGLG